MRIPKDERSGEVPKLKGFGYVEFEDRDSLLNALVIPDTVSFLIFFFFYLNSGLVFSFRR